VLRSRTGKLNLSAQWQSRVPDGAIILQELGCVKFSAPWRLVVGYDPGARPALPQEMTFAK